MLLKNLGVTELQQLSNASSKIFHFQNEIYIYIYYIIILLLLYYYIIILYYYYIIFIIYIIDYYSSRMII